MKGMKMKNKEIEELLNKLKKCRDYDDEVLLIKQYGADLLLSYIEQLEKENELHFEIKKVINIQKENNKLKRENKQLENNRDKAIELLESIPINANGGEILDVERKVLHILKGDSDE